MTACGSSDAFMWDQAWNCWLMTVKKVAVEKKTSAQGGSSGLAARPTPTKGSAGLNTLCTLFANWRSVMVHGRWWCACRCSECSFGSSGYIVPLSVNGTKAVHKSMHQCASAASNHEDASTILVSSDLISKQAGSRSSCRCLLRPYLEAGDLRAEDRSAAVAVVVDAWRKVRLTSSRHGPHGLGYTRVEMEFYKTQALV